MTLSLPSSSSDRRTAGTDRATDVGGSTFARRLRSRLFFKYVVLFVGVVGLALLTNGIFEVFFYYREHRASLVRIQHEQAEAAAAKISQFVKEIESQLGWTVQLPWSAGSVEQRRFDALRLLRQVPAVTELAQADASGKERLRVSRLAMDVIDSGIDLSKDPKFADAVAKKVYYGPVYFRRESEPYMTLAIAGTRRDAGVSIAEVNLKLIWDVVSQIKVGLKGHAYVVDGQGRLIAHPDISLVLRNTDLSSLPQVKAARTAGAPTEQLEGLINIQGQNVLTASAPINPLGWTMFVELPVEEAYASLYTALQRLALVLLAALLFAVLAGTFLARRMVVPIQALRDGAARIGGGDFAQRIRIETGDELEGLADQFNEMGARLQESYADLENKVELRTQELRESLQFQTATSDVLRVISRSPNELQPVLDVIVETARQLCSTETSTVFLLSDGKFRVAALSGDEPEYHAWLRNNPLDPDQRGSVTTRAAREKRAIHVPDSALDQEAGVGPLGMGQRRAVLSVPLLKDGNAVGVITLVHKEPVPFSPRQVEVVETFADQAVIAISNVRLFEQVQERTRELSQSLEELRTAQDRLVQTEKLASLGQLTAGIAHEIKNPLNFVNNFSALSTELIDELNEILAGASLDDKTRDDVEELGGMLKSNLEKVVQHGKRADSIVKNMLLHSREGSGDHRPTDINGLVEESLNLAYHGARAEKSGFNITLERNFDPAAGAVDLYPQEITRVFLNIISNGFYAATKRKGESADGFEPRLSATTRNLGDRVEIRIRDNGTGIPPEVKEKMFNPFFTTKPAGEGTGLGLSMSHDIIVKQHGGTIDVLTEPNSYTEFVIVLPREAAAQKKVGGQK